MHVECNNQGRVTRLQVLPEESVHVEPTSNAVAPSGVPVPPEVARLSRLHALEDLDIYWVGLRWDALIPHEWIQPGAFPRLLTLELHHANGSDGPLPDIPPGALPSLQELSLTCSSLRSTLPHGWGANPRVLPALQRLVVTVQVQGGLPSSWGPGFGSSMQTISIVNTVPQTPDTCGCGAAATQAPECTAVPAPSLPARWAAQLPALRMLRLANLGLGGSFPGAWLAPDSFPSGLTHLDVTDNALTGTLPSHLFTRFPNLDTAVQNGNKFAGKLPPEWASSKAARVAIINNCLSGPAFPPAWLANGSMPRLQHLQVGGNTALTGTLPPQLPWQWPSLISLYLAGTGMSGTIPAAWCLGPKLHSLSNLNISGTAVDPAPPPCTESYSVHVVSSLGPATGRTEPDMPAQRRPWPAAGLSAALPLAVLLAAGLASRALVRQRVRQHRRQPSAAVEQQCLLQLGNLEQQQAEGAAAGGGAQQQQQRQRQPGHEWRQCSSEADSSLQQRRALPVSLVRQAHQHGRLAGLLSAALAGKGVIQVSSGDSPLPHKLGAQHVPAGVCALELVLPRGSTGSAAGSAGPAGPPHTGSGRWGLPTESLRIQPEHLEFILDSQGEFVVLGTGAHAMVLMARLLAPGYADSVRLTAVKVFELEAGVDSGTVWLEVAMVQRCRHPRVVPLLGVVLQSRLLMVAMEVMHHGSLQLVLVDPQRRDELRWEARGRQVAVDVAEALDHLHTQLGVMHGDLKPGNVLLSTDWRACLADMGLAQLLGTGARTAVGFTRAYAAPEQIMGQRCTLSADMYSFGLLLVALLTREMTSGRGGWRLPRVPDECPEEVAALVDDCLLLDPGQRPTAAQALKRLRAVPPPRTIGS